MAGLERPRRAKAGAAQPWSLAPSTPAGWRAQLIAARFGLTLEAAAIVASLALGGAHG